VSRVSGDPGAKYGRAGETTRLLALRACIGCELPELTEHFQKVFGNHVEPSVEVAPL
jgi:hypothetical protein